MSHEHEPQIPNSINEKHLSPVPEAILQDVDFPVTTTGLDKEQLHLYDRAALMTIGRLGSYRAYETVDLWIIEPNAQARHVREQAELFEPGELQITKAAMYISKLRLMQIVPPKTPGQEDKNRQAYMRYDFYRTLDHDVQRMPQEAILIKRRQAARVGIFAAMLYQRNK